MHFVATAGADLVNDLLASIDQITRPTRYTDDQNWEELGPNKQSIDTGSHYWEDLGGGGGTLGPTMR